MNIHWHCRDCNEQGDCSISALELCKMFTEGKLIDKLIAFVKKEKHTEHENIGVRAL